MRIDKKIKQETHYNQESQNSDSSKVKNKEQDKTKKKEQPLKSK